LARQRSASPSRRLQSETHGLGAFAIATRIKFVRAYYTEGEFKKAVAHFQLSLKVDPNDAESYYWMGMSYQVLADIDFPFAGKYTSKACVASLDFGYG
jgi:tetratricopeptide (TPR) repeat protein